MALVLGWTPGDARESYFWGDESVDWGCRSLRAREEAAAARGVEADTLAAEFPHDGSVCADCVAMADYLKTGEACHLRLRENGVGAPTRIVFRALTSEERASVTGLCRSDFPSRTFGESDEAYLARAQRETSGVWWRLLYWCFCVGVEMPDEPLVRRVRGRGGLTMLPAAAVNSLVAVYGDAIYEFYGRLVWEASVLTEDEKKTSSSRRTGTSSKTATLATASGSAPGTAPTSDSTTRDPDPSAPT